MYALQGKKTADAPERPPYRDTLRKGEILFYKITDGKSIDRAKSIVFSFGHTCFPFFPRCLWKRLPAFVLPAVQTGRHQTGDWQRRQPLLPHIQVKAPFQTSDERRDKVDRKDGRHSYERGVFPFVPERLLLTLHFLFFSLAEQEKSVKSDNRILR